MTEADAPDPAAEQKRRLRRQIIAVRDHIPPEERARRSDAICGAVTESPELRRATCALLFAPFGSEVDTRGLLRATLEAGKRLALPRVNPETRVLELREVTCPDTQLAPGLWDIPEPQPEVCPEVGLDEIDFVLIPGVAFDRNRGRLGYGGGYYDRLLAGLSEAAGAVAIAFDAQIVAEVPRSVHDLRAPAIITESERID